jgi:hypothetical protein
MKVGICHSVIPTEATGSRAVCGAQERIRGLVKRRRICKDLSMRPRGRGRDPSTTLGMTDIFAAVMVLFLRAANHAKQCRARFHSSLVAPQDRLFDKARVARRLRMTARLYATY